MILGVGLDIVELSRIRRAWARFGTRFVEKILHPDEIASLREPVVPYLAARFAAKEAAVKALGTGFRQGIAPVDIAVTNLPCGKPVLHFYGNAAERVTDIGATLASISLTHGKETAAAVVILEADHA